MLPFDKLSQFWDGYPDDGLLITEIPAFKLELLELRLCVHQTDHFGPQSLFTKTLNKMTATPN